MSILITAATAAELTSFSNLHDPHQDIPCETLVTGVGLLATSLSLCKHLQQKKPSLVIQVGIAGTFNDALLMGDAVVVASDAIGDMGVMENGTFKTVFEMGLTNPDHFPYKGGRLINPHAALIQQTGLKTVHGISVNEISTSNDRIRFYREQLGAETESMEGAALHMVCLENNIPFVQIRGISNRVGERDKSKWKIPEAIGSVNNAVKHLINNLNPSA